MSKHTHTHPGWAGGHSPSRVEWPLGRAQGIQRLGQTSGPAPGEPELYRSNGKQRSSGTRARTNQWKPGTHGYTHTGYTHTPDTHTDMDNGPCLVQGDGAGQLLFYLSASCETHNNQLTTRNTQHSKRKTASERHAWDRDTYRLGRDRREKGGWGDCTARGAAMPRVRCAGVPADREDGTPGIPGSGWVPVYP